MEKPHEHHVIFPRLIHNSMKVTKELRAERMLRPPIAQDPHTELHKHIGMVAIPSWTMASEICKRFEPVEGDYISSLDNLIFAISDTIKHPKVRELERSIGDVMVHGLDLQRPYIKAGLILPH